MIDIFIKPSIILKFIIFYFIIIFSSYSNKSFSIINKRSYEIPKDSTSYIKKERFIINNQKSASIILIKIKKSKNISSRNLNMSRNSYERRKSSNKSLFNYRVNYSFNRLIRSNNKYINNFKKKLNYESKCKINLLIKRKKKKKQYKKMPLTNSRKNINNLDKLNTYGNITINNSDK